MGKLRLGKTSGSLAHDLIGLPQLAVLPLMRLELLGNLGGTQTAVHLTFLRLWLSVCPMPPMLAAIDDMAARREGVFDLVIQNHPNPGGPDLS